MSAGAAPGPLPGSEAGAPPSATAAQIEPYAAILAHAELELELAGRGELDALIELGERWQQLVAAAPPTPPNAAAPLLERATLIHERTRIELERLRRALLQDAVTAERASRTAAGYASGLGAEAPRVRRSA